MSIFCLNWVYPNFSIMKPSDKKEKKGTSVRRYSDHPVVKEKLAKANEVLEKADLTFLKIPVTLQSK
jgi:hypothetical protein